MGENSQASIEQISKSKAERRKIAYPQVAKLVLGYARRFFEDPLISMKTLNSVIFVTGSGSTCHKIFVRSLLEKEFGIEPDDTDGLCKVLELRSHKNLRDLAKAILNNLPENSKSARRKKGKGSTDQTKN